MLDKSTNAIEELTRRSPAWIAAAEWLPIVKGEYICKIKCPKGEWIEIDFWDNKDWYSTDWPDEKATEFVTHWMPLP